MTLHDFQESHITIPVIGTSFLLQGRLCVPESTPNHNANDSTPPQKPVETILILHGFLGHKDYCYQKLLAHEIPKRTGRATLRFDFMACGDSFPPNIVSRTIQNDIRDLDSVLEWIRAYNKTAKTKGYRPLELVGGVAHSRGSHSLLAWSAVHALQSLNAEQLPEIVRTLKYHATPGVAPLASPLRFLASCSGRYRTSYLMESYLHRLPDFAERGGERLTLRRPASGKVVDSWVSYSDIADLSSVPIGQLLDILISLWGQGKDSNLEGSRFLTLFGDADHIVPVMDAFLYTTHFARAVHESQNSSTDPLPLLVKQFSITGSYEDSLKKVDGTNKRPWIYQRPLPHSLQKLVLVPNADHNFYGKPRAYMPSEKRANYSEQVVSAVLDWMNEVDQETIAKKLATDNKSARL
ncbi:uncharacterized protein SAPINGB_P001266 [Magnusiomyces paraingens]|uniref:AB hydrolase-1 domain-containing protein n=1 Tax=Magnusiomyces paraingens TaxID=2606893 RepID=A0A5E8BB11_9ASCO|nr:uncharacterized protein SAPINGB_P001266 [Saprochaete ingens]VVT46544.1 unnamed protein product [Saprochaete ingens]